MNTPMARRTVLLGAGFSLIAAEAVSREAAVGMSGDVVQSDAELIALGYELDQVRTRCRVLKAEKDRRADKADAVCQARAISRSLPDRRRNPDFDRVRVEVGYDAAWKWWSKAIDESLALAARIDELPASGLAGVAIKFDAMLWSQFHDTMADAIDAEHLGALRAFGREVHQLARAERLNHC